MSGRGRARLSRHEHDSKEPGFCAAGSREPLRVVRVRSRLLDRVVSLTDAGQPGDSATAVDHGSGMPAFALLAIPGKR